MHNSLPRATCDPHSLTSFLQPNPNPTTSGISRISKKSRTAGKCKVGESSQAPPPSRLDTWFTKERHKVEYSGVFGNKNVILPKFIKTQWFRDKGFMFPNFLEYQGLIKFMELSGDFYPRLVKVFYTIVRATMDRHLHAEVKGTKIVVDDDVWEKVAGVTCAGIRKFDEHVEGYIRIGTYREMLLGGLELKIG